MNGKPETEVLRRLAPRQKKQMRELVSSLLDSSGNQREYIISVLLSQASPERGGEPSLRSLRTLTSNILVQLIYVLRAQRNSRLSQYLDFFRFLKHFPLDGSPELEQALAQAFGRDPGPTEEEARLFQRLQLLYLLAKLGDFIGTQQPLKALYSEVDLSNPRLYIMHRIALARYLQHRDKRLEFTTLWLNLVSDFYQLDGSDSALYVVLRWITILNWGRETATKKMLLQKFGPGLRHMGNLLSANLVYALFTLENKLVTPAEKMNYARLLFKLPHSLFTAQQLQFIYFFAGNYYSGMHLSYQKSIRYYQHSNYYLHKSWVYLQGLSRFLRQNLVPSLFARTMQYLERWVIELGSQMSLQNNAYVQTLHDNFDIIHDLYRKVEELSITDNLTGLKNRRFLANNLTHLFRLAARHKVPVCFAMLDIDHFKLVNDEYGHLAGDKVLKDLAGILTSSFRKSDVIVRYGGEEFLMIFFDIQSERFQGMMEDLCRKVREHGFTFGGRDIHISVSIGITCGTGTAYSQKYIDSCIEKADAALYLAKSRGRNKVFNYESE
ncbi:MAG: GGDEF domain-containing protein, partial [Candidatus Syntrophosphaera sp.]